MSVLWFDASRFIAADHLDRGCQLMQSNRFAEALAEFEAAISIDPTDHYARYNRCTTLLSLGDYARGMPEHDWAWKIWDWRALGPVQGNLDRLLQLPLWKGESCKLIAYHEMGFGDAIMMTRFLPELAERCPEVTLVVRPELVSLMRGRGVNVVDYVPQDVGKFDARVTLFNSIHVMEHSAQTIPSEPYIKTDFKFSGGRMGIAWSGNSRKEFSLTNFLHHLDNRDFKFYALQKAAPVDGVVPLQARSFRETADLMATLDCIVTVDTAAGHLAGAIGHPNAHVVIPYLRDWRWWNKSVWYPTLNIYPQDHPNDWHAPFRRVNEALRNG
jgi:tetratricopeptide (TPR) repeat protein